MNIKYAYLDFIKYSVNHGDKIPPTLDELDWNDYLQFCNCQGIVGIIFDGIQRADIRVPESVLVKWISLDGLIKRRNLLVNKRIGEIVSFFDNNNARSCILKGQANALMYLKPELRSPGDIDIWVEGEKSDIIRLSETLVPATHFSIHHIKLPVFKDVSVEVHYRPIYLTNWFADRRLQRYINEVKERQFSHHKMLGSNEIGCLTDDFNVVYQLLHMYHHFFETRNNFKQFIDYFFLLKQANVGDIEEDANRRIKQLSIAKYASGIMWIMKEILGLEDSKLLFEPNEKEGKLILKESFYYGTFSTNKIRSIIEQTIANFRITSHYPKEVLISPIFLFWHQWWRLKTCLFKS